MRNPGVSVRLTSFGSAGKRSAKQAAAAVASFHTVYDAIPKDGIIVFTDGSAVPILARVVVGSISPSLQYLDVLVDPSPLCVPLGRAPTISVSSGPTDR